jgi:RimJ/RimL family protein N-acetyltransferase
VSGPVLVTERLVLRPHQAQDFEDLAALWGDGAVVRHIGGRPFTEEEVWARLLRYVGHWAVAGYGYFAVREAQSGRFVGDVGLSDGRRALDPLFDDAPEAGWALAPWAQGRGYAAEALAAVLAWSDATLKAPRTVCLIDPQNRPSIRLAERFGYRRYAEADYKGGPVLLFERAAQMAPVGRDC